MNRKLSARLEPFDSYWQSPDDVESGFKSFFEYYKHNYLPMLPEDKSVRILVVSCGPGYLLHVLQESGYTNVLGIDSDNEKLEPARKRNLPCENARAFEFLESSQELFDVIIPEQELNHLTLDETFEFLSLCRSRITDGGLIVAYGLNGANPFVGSENLSQNIDHFYTFTEHSLLQIMEASEFKDIKIHPLKIYVFWKNPLNYIGILVTGGFELMCKLMFKLYGKHVTVLSKKIAVTAHK